MERDLQDRPVGTADTEELRAAEAEAWAQIKGLVDFARPDDDQYGATWDARVSLRDSKGPFRHR